MTRLRLNSTVVGIRVVDGKHVDVDYVQQGNPLRVTADHCVLACNNALIPHLCPEMPQAQKEGLNYGVRTPFASYEQQIREQLQSMLGKHGFKHETDIRAITVNRIPHGYAYPYLALDDPEWEEGQAPHEIGRAQFGRISIANTDSEAIALMDAAFDAAWRAVEEQTA